jgi:Spy/CpxP family protein refolding chaperone
VYWPYAYSDVFYYTFWPYAYDDGFWDYAYDDFFDGIFFPYGAPYADDYADAGPYASVTTGSTARASVPGRVSKSVERVCSQPASGVTAWPFARIETAVAPTDEQKALLTELKKAAGEAADRFKQACPDNVALTPVGRLDAMLDRLQATLDAVKLVRPPLEKFYASLSDEQQARFNAIGPDLGKKQQPQEAENDKANTACSSDKAGLTAAPIDRIEDAVDPTDEQGKQLDKLSAAMNKAVQGLEKACPDYVAQTPVGRLQTMQQRLEAMIAAANTVRPPLEDFYASLTAEQKASFNDLGQKASRKHSSVRHHGSSYAARHMIRHIQSMLHIR